MKKHIEKKCLVQKEMSEEVMTKIAGKGISVSPHLKPSTVPKDTNALIFTEDNELLIGQASKKKTLVVTMELGSKTRKSRVGWSILFKDNYFYQGLLYDNALNKSCFYKLLISSYDTDPG